jgi:hypothetical protein
MNGIVVSCCVVFTSFDRIWEERGKILPNKRIIRKVPCLELVKRATGFADHVYCNFVSEDNEIPNWHISSICEGMWCF